MSDELEEKLRSEVLAGTWEDLAPQFARGGLLVVAPTVDLLAAATAVASDDTARVEGWLAERELRRATDEDAQAWSAETRFRFVILQPWVLAQRLGTGAEGP